MNRKNNFNLIRLLAAIQVMVIHTATHLNITIPSGLKYIAGLFPGVPIFFFISGFLIYGSYLSNPEVKPYLFNRFKRIFPGLWACLAITLAILFIFHAPKISTFKAVSWIFSQITIFQLWTPSEWKSFGAGSPNGVLWTIPVEIMFYLFIPLFFYICKRKYHIIGLIMLFIISYSYNQYAETFRGSHYFELMTKNLLPYLFFFILGMFNRLLFNKFKIIYEYSGIFWLGIFLVLVGTLKAEMTYYPNLTTLLTYIVLSITTISMAYTFPSLTNKLIGETDISYGIYLYHMPIVNILLLIGLKNNPILFVSVSFFTTILAMLSWFLVERECLRLKYKTYSPQAVPKTAHL